MMLGRKKNFNNIIQKNILKNHVYMNASICFKNIFKNNKNILVIINKKYKNEDNIWRYNHRKNL